MIEGFKGLAARLGVPSVGTFCASFSKQRRRRRGGVACRRRRRMEGSGGGGGGCSLVRKGHLHAIAVVGAQRHFFRRLRRELPRGTHHEAAHAPEGGHAEPLRLGLGKGARFG